MSSSGRTGIGGHRADQPAANATSEDDHSSKGIGTKTLPSEESPNNHPDGDIRDKPLAPPNTSSGSGSVIGGHRPGKGKNTSTASTEPAEKTPESGDPAKDESDDSIKNKSGEPDKKEAANPGENGNDPKWEKATPSQALVSGASLLAQRPFIIKANLLTPATTPDATPTAEVTGSILSRTLDQPNGGVFTTPGADASVIPLATIRKLIPAMSRFAKIHKFCTRSGTVVEDEQLDLGSYLGLEPAGQPAEIGGEKATASLDVYYRRPAADPVTALSSADPPKASDVPAPDMSLTDHSADALKAKSLADLKAPDLISLINMQANTATVQPINAGQLTEAQWASVLRNCGVFYGWIVDPKTKAVRQAPQPAFQLRSPEVKNNPPPAPTISGTATNATSQPGSTPAPQPASSSQQGGTFDAASSTTQPPATQPPAAVAQGDISGSVAPQSTPADNQGGIFGSVAPQTAPASDQGGIFGSTTTQPAPAGGQGGIFGAAASQPASTSGQGGIFGSTASQPTPASGQGGIFGSATTQPAPAGGQGGIFGSTSSQPASTNSQGGIFGSLASPAALTSGGPSSVSDNAQPQPTPSSVGDTSQPAAPAPAAPTAPVPSLASPSKTSKSGSSTAAVSKSGGTTGAKSDSIVSTATTDSQQYDNAASITSAASAFQASANTMNNDASSTTTSTTTQDMLTPATSNSQTTSQTSMNANNTEPELESERRARLAKEVKAKGDVVSPLRDDFVDIPGIPPKLGHVIPNFRVNDDSKIDISVCTHSLAVSMARNDFSSQDTEASVSGGAFGVTVGVGAGYASSQSSAHSEETSSSTKTMIARYMYPRCDLFLTSTDLEPSPGFAALLETIHKTKSIRALRKLQSEYGQLFCQELTLGARLLSTQTMDSRYTGSTDSQKEQFKVSVSLSVQTPYGGASMKHSEEKGHDSSTSKSESTTNETNAFEASGGDTILANNPPAWCASVASCDTWRIINRQGLSSLVGMLSEMPGYAAVQSWFVQAVPALSKYLTLDDSHIMTARFKVLSPNNSLQVRNTDGKARHYLGFYNNSTSNPCLNTTDVTTVVGNVFTNFWLRIDATVERRIFEPSSYRAPVIQGFNDNDVAGTMYGANYSDMFASVTWDVIAPFSDVISHGTRVILRTKPVDPQKTAPVQMLAFRNAQGEFVPGMSDRDEYQYWRILLSKPDAKPGTPIKANDEVRLAWSFKDQTTGYRDYCDDVFGRRQTVAPAGMNDVLYLKVPWPRFENEGHPTNMILSSEASTSDSFVDLNTKMGTYKYALQDLKFRLDTVENSGKGDSEDYMMENVAQQGDQVVGTTVTIRTPGNEMQFAQTIWGFGLLVR